MDTRIRLKILLDIGLCLFPADAEILAQTERTDAVYDTEVDRLRISSLQRCYLFKRHMEHFRCRHAVDILRLAVRLNQVFIARHMGQHAELNLGIVGIQKDTARLWHEGFPDQTAKLHPHRNVLQIRIGTADAAGRGDGLVKCRMDSSIFPDHGLQTVGVRRFQFGKLAVLQNIGNEFVIRCELFEHIGGGGITRLGLFAARKLQLFKQNHAELLRGIDVELLAGLFVDLCLQLSDPLRQLSSVNGKCFFFCGDSIRFHLTERKHQRNLHIPVQIPHALLLQKLFHVFLCGKYSIRLMTCIRLLLFRRHLSCGRNLASAEDLFHCRHIAVYVLFYDIIVRIL